MPINRALAKTLPPVSPLAYSQWSSMGRPELGRNAGSVALPNGGRPRPPPSHPWLRHPRYRQHRHGGKLPHHVHLLQTLTEPEDISISEVIGFTNILPATLEDVRKEKSKGISGRVPSTCLNDAIPAIIVTSMEIP
ncbi:uncharacterized protein LOC121840787 isoform X1 [Oncorhynchus tshawytscha]|uniref:uncharacterized protein LOC121840787 isoform X1 n=1 Tax=Oncorhynchus tshawytscha TaxID=74940 RepID=UPI001C3DB09F|nr:uncharacterized protein LOC121840787 isoform X1 [Oncorhynchus tshawytscha]